MRITLAYPENGTQVVVDIDDPAALNALYEKRVGQDIEGEKLGGQFKGYLFRIGGGFDKQGFPMKQGVITPRRIRLLLKTGASCYRPRKDGERKRKTVRGCIISDEISALHCVVLQKGEKEIDGLTTTVVPRRFGPKRASTLRAMFGITDSKFDASKLVLKREVKPGKFTSPKVQRLITARRVARKNRMLKERKEKREATKKKAEQYQALLKQQQKQ
ncbi:ribosomal protein S6e, putative [Trichomonas vaginalis G3]|uniref:40S ribosomal protein S6 n=1 Tax=Trichomonas vaginalis (strain ATCC PRA-98 / G3) TaxID=412133 RepID=A2DEJ9_TRIV3|nr:Chain G 40s Ribosomal Protein S6 [Trichomonas vaginalis G3]XP_001326473.1 Chain G 40s Ribosomal Protein S6 [Trichomonas vaginalis G3]XP_001579581.1 Chain G 40s Ribosomal Protein S6 [Trichomonas vaginalis G3]XP_001582112.1 Chain G 40s Ribosomal Protein S6 [Trichomonas vaginalis G3]5XYI_G Chain G, 40S ribosomal protein S6 [Trichomonas vaginalis]EAX87967.1 ribosomal protein S6e, putative [Trichomonas vaginalis G3]EAY14250.1 ribosomal protein S6e, putative [Trichomonas vaginalis G3]EAY18595.1|eukprot:XP_001300897.1 ribosomal protein S6e [Trichomonas vaginalis G3]